MRRNRTVQIPAQTQTFLDVIVCDLCGAESARMGEWDVPDHTYATTAVGITLVDDPGWPDQPYKTPTTFDLCPACFTGKLMPWLEDQGVQIKTEEDAE